MTILPALILSSAMGAGVCGSIEYAGPVRILNLWGAWEEMGYAEGYLLGPEIVDLYDHYMVELAGGVSMVEYARQFVLANFDMPDEFADMARGMLEGIADTCGLYSPVYGRDLDTLDIWTAACAPDLSSIVLGRYVDCSSTSAWGAATAADPVLQGDPAVSRNLDYFIDSGTLILQGQVLRAIDPDDGQEWISAGIPGFMGCLSGMNSHGVCAALNMGNHYGISQWSPAFVPICTAQALGLSNDDFDGSGQCDLEDVEAALTTWNRSCSYCIHVLSPPALSSGDPAEVVEVNNPAGWTVRTDADDPGVAPEHLIVTNHHRKLYPPVSCWRYQSISASIAANPAITLDRLWDLMGDVGFPPQPGTGGTVQTMILMPCDLRIGLAFAAPGSPSYSQDPQWMDWDDIFPNHSSGVVEGGIESAAPAAWPNPCTEELCVSWPGASGLIVRDVTGRLVAAAVQPLGGGEFAVRTGALPRGIYLVADPGSTGTALKVLAVGR